MVKIVSAPERGHTPVGYEHCTFGTPTCTDIPHSFARGRKLPSFLGVPRRGSVGVLTRRTVKPSGETYALGPCFRSEEIDCMVVVCWKRELYKATTLHYYAIPTTGCKPYVHRLCVTLELFLIGLWYPSSCLCRVKPSSQGVVWKSQVYCEWEWWEVQRVQCLTKVTAIVKRCPLHFVTGHRWSLHYLDSVKSQVSRVTYLGSSWVVHNMHMVELYRVLGVKSTDQLSRVTYLGIAVIGMTSRPLVTWFKTQRWWAKQTKRGHDTAAPSTSAKAQQTAFSWFCF